MEQPTPTPPTEQQELFTEADYSMEGYDKPIRNARIMLFIIAAMQLLPIILLGDVSQEEKTVTIIVSVTVALMFAGLAFWTKKKPFIALLLAMILYVGLLALNAILMGPATLFTGFVVKIIVIVLLIMGLRNAKEAEDLRKTYGK